MSYSVVKNDIGSYDLLEKDSETVIQIRRAEEKEARSMCRKLNLGAGFVGWTPDFLAKSLDINTNMT
jgi:hypothetical protein